ncbi:hypothetical protein R3P38DRAFT_3007311 [Favolaschia claudopus]|uniref:Uncharacterized protein n=1 Tax=Favolaschia claudopus TaxID=2862362 RepID=A0AAW0AJR6_9AGAR
MHARFSFPFAAEKRLSISSARSFSLRSPPLIHPNNLISRLLPPHTRIIRRCSSRRWRASFPSLLLLLSRIILPLLHTSFRFALSILARRLRGGGLTHPQKVKLGPKISTRFLLASADRRWWILEDDSGGGVSGMVMSAPVKQTAVEGSVFHDWRFFTSLDPMLLHGISSINIMANGNWLDLHEIFLALDDDLVLRRCWITRRRSCFAVNIQQDLKPSGEHGVLSCPDEVSPKCSMEHLESVPTCTYNNRWR